MSSTVQTAYAPVRLSRALLAAVRRICGAIIDNRQRQADLLVANHLRELPDQFLEGLGVSRAEIERLTKLARSDTAHALTDGKKRGPAHGSCNLTPMSFGATFQSSKG
jgi:uncharacterized protein YjiS (DUF1127 family)